MAKSNPKSNSLENSLAKLTAPLLVIVDYADSLPNSGKD
jgi:hypothetical protein